MIRVEPDGLLELRFGLTVASEAPEGQTREVARLEIAGLSRGVVADFIVGRSELAQRQQGLDQRNARKVVAGLQPQSLAVGVRRLLEAALLGIHGRQVEEDERRLRMRGRKFLKERNRRRWIPVLGIGRRQRNPKA